VRVARVIERLPPATGGKEIHAAELSRALRLRLVDDVLFWHEGNVPPGARGVKQMRARSQLRDVQVLTFSAWACKAVAHAHRVRPFDLVHAHGDFPEAAVAALLAKRLGAPALLTVHGAVSEVTWHRYARRITYSPLARILTVTEEIAAQLRQSDIGVPVIVRPSGVRDPFFRVVRAPADVPTVLTVGRLHPTKGLEVLIAARDKLADSEVRWVLAAGGNGEYAARLRREIARRPNMHLLNVASPRELAELHSRAHVFVLPSVQRQRQAEGMPTALMEALATRTPVIATDTGGVSRALGGGKFGVLVPPGDSDALAHAVRRVLAAPDDARIRAEQAARTGLSQGWDEVAEQVHGIYTQVLQGPSSTGTDQVHQR